MATYAELLRDPRWQKKRLEIMERDSFACVICHDTKTTLNVDHAYYDFGRDPWDYENESLATVCEPCHLGLEFSRKIIKCAVKHLDHFSLADVADIVSGKVTGTAREHFLTELTQIKKKLSR